jgi:hypothetical protein
LQPYEVVKSISLFKKINTKGKADGAGFEQQVQTMHSAVTNHG